MNEPRFILSCIIALLAVLAGGCGTSTEKENHVKVQEWLNESPVDTAQAIDILLDKGGIERSNLLRNGCSIEKDSTTVVAGEYIEIGEFARNERSIFYVKNYAKDGAQSYYRSQIYYHDFDAEEDVLLYETSQNVWLNEFLANNTYLYWVENVYSKEKKGDDYNIMQYNLSTGEVTCIAGRNETESDDICLAVSDEYVTWYDSYQNENIKIVVFNIEKQELQTIQDTTVQRFMPYERLNIVDGGITYFAQDTEGRIFINRYHLETQQKDILLLGKMSTDDKLAACFSNEEYIGWLTEYSYGTYYFYHMETGKLYSLRQSEDLRVFSGFLADGFYINDSVSERIYVYDFEEGQAYYQDIPHGFAMSLKPYGEKLLYTKFVADGYVGMITVQYDK